MPEDVSAPRPRVCGYAGLERHHELRAVGRRGVLLRRAVDAAPRPRAGRDDGGHPLAPAPRVTMNVTSWPGVNCAIGISTWLAPAALAIFTPAHAVAVSCVFSVASFQAPGVAILTSSPVLLEVMLNSRSFADCTVTPAGIENRK